MRNTLAIFGLLFLCCLNTNAQSAPFPFVIPWADNTKSIIDVSALNPAPLTEKSRLVVKNGHFYDQTGRRVRFIGTALGAGEVFPTHENAEKLAAHLHRFGINMIRLHHMDAPWAEPGLFYFTGKAYGRTTQKLDPTSLDRLDYLIYQFKKYGIYADMNLHVTRQWNSADGFPDADKINQEGKVVAYFEPRAYELQKLYAKQLVTHFNPYTKTSYADEPTVAVMEIDNEDSLVGSADTIPTMPAHYRDIISKGWNAYLKKKYVSTAGLKKAWNANAKPLGATILQNGRFTDGTANWSQEQQNNTSYNFEVVGVEGATNAPSGRALHIKNLKTDATDWHTQAHYTGLNLKEGGLYTVSFAARANGTRNISVQMRYDREPWSFVGLDKPVALTSNWTRCSFSFNANKPDPNHCRLSFVLGGSDVDVYLADVALRPGGGGVSLSVGKTIEAGTVDIPGIEPTAPGRDYVEYLMNVENTYAQGIRSYVQQTLKSNKPFICSQASYGGIAGVYRESKMDWVDMHAYWQHPSFPGLPFDMNNYLTPNTAMVKDLGMGALAGLAMHRVAGKPFTVSEYDHPAPNEYAAECVPTIFSYAAAQDWDGVFLFAFSSTPSDHLTNFFDIGNNPAKMAFLPAAAQIFLHPPDGPSTSTMTLSVPVSQVATLKAQGSDYNFWSKASTPPKDNDWLNSRAYVRFTDTPGIVTMTKKTAVNAPPVSLTMWDHKSGIYGYISKNAWSVVGFLGGAAKPGEEGPIIAASERNFASITVTTMDGKPENESSSILITALDKTENPGLQWNADRTFAANGWYRGPVMVTGVDAIIPIQTKSSKAVVYALDSSGKRVREIPTELAKGRLTVHIKPEYQAVWYEVAAMK